MVNSYNHCPCDAFPSYYKELKCNSSTEIQFSGIKFSLEKFSKSISILSCIIMRHVNNGDTAEGDQVRILKDKYQLNDKPYYHSLQKLCKWLIAVMPRSYPVDCLAPPWALNSFIRLATAPFTGPCSLYRLGCSSFCELSNVRRCFSFNEYI